jgi:Rod binding domain-containing protein
MRAVTTPYDRNGGKAVSSDRSSSSGGRTVATFSVEDFKRGVSIGFGDQSASPAPSAQTEQTGPTVSTASDASGSSAASNSQSGRELLAARPEGLPAGAFGRRYRPLENGRLADAGLRVQNLTEEQKLAKISEIKKSAEEYEGMLINEMIKSMRQSPFVKTPGGDTYSEIAEKPFTAALTAAGGLGLSQTIVTQIAAQEGLGDVLAANPEVMGPGYRQRLAPSLMPKAGPKAISTLGTTANDETKLPTAQSVAIETTEPEAGPL